MDSVCVFADCTWGDQGINAGDTDLTRARETPKGRDGVEQDEEDECGSHFDLERQHREDEAKRERLV